MRAEKETEVRGVSRETQADCTCRVDTFSLMGRVSIYNGRTQYRNFKKNGNEL
jgi:hypothetical protein